MHLALLSYEYPPDTGFGGIGTYAYYQARALVKLGHQVTVIAGATRPGVFKSEHDGVRVVRIKREGWSMALLDAQWRRRCGWFASRLAGAHAAYEGLVHLMQRETVDAVEMPECGADGMLVTTLLQVPTVVKYHSPARLIMGMYETPRVDRTLTELAEQIAINQASAHMSCSRFLAAEVARVLGVRKPIAVVANGIDVALFDRDEGIDVHARFGVPRGATTVLFANRMEERKGVHVVRDVALRLLPKYPDLHFVLAGRDPFGWMQHRILPAIDAAGVRQRFHYLGPLGLPEVRALLKATDVFLLASLWENCPYSCLEAMTAARTIVSSDCGGMPELIQHRTNGLLARSEDAASFAAALSEAIEDRALRQRLGAAARRSIEAAYTDVAIAERAVAVYRAAQQEAVRG